MGLQTLGCNRREVLPRDCSLMHRAGWIRDRILYNEHGRTIYFAVSDVDPPTLGLRLMVGFLLGS